MKDKKNINIWDQDLKENSGGFHVPINYFDTLEDRIIPTMITQDKPRKSRLIPIKPWVVMAASISQ